MEVILCQFLVGLEIFVCFGAHFGGLSRYTFVGGKWYIVDLLLCRMTLGTSVVAWSVCIADDNDTDGQNEMVMYEVSRGFLWG